MLEYGRSLSLPTPEQLSASIRHRFENPVQTKTSFVENQAISIYDQYIVSKNTLIHFLTKSKSHAYLTLQLREGYAWEDLGCVSAFETHDEQNTAKTRYVEVMLEAENKYIPQSFHFHLKIPEAVDQQPEVEAFLYHLYDGFQKPLELHPASYNNLLHFNKLLEQLESGDV